MRETDRTMLTYLEFSDGTGKGHKFYEARTEGSTLTLRYGRIGTEGQTQVKSFPTPEAALAEADRKLTEKRSKGYVEATLGERGKQAVPVPALRLPKALAAHRDALETSVRPYVSLTGHAGKAQPWTSKLGGTPYRPLGSAWPHAQDGTPLAFLAQINFAEMSLLGDFPGQGIVQFFIRGNDFYGANLDAVHYDMAALASTINFQVIYHPAVVEDETQLDLKVPAVPAEDFGLPHDPATTYVLRGTLKSGPVTTDDRAFEAVTGHRAWELLGADEAGEDEVEHAFERYAKLAGTGHKLGGYPNFTQNDPRALEDPHVLLFQLDSDDDLNMMWGDVGIANFFISPQDLAQRDFSRVAYHWDCG
ncbi:DUF1963 domain-containing protein [Deinococcus cavernae]|uniref:DUF1963 domain-containing protein n=1 Tax=Deinococcus cavernae TaxID=2320857 RepID=A0A418V5X0_9DEIO|nr:DUF1963 domain-containing protein [Deinococcus cavernae]RJF71492.1 DUF1963 domain-containing protein [Deinococcus cavernae]